MQGVRSFNIPVTQMSAAAEFYRKVFDWGIEPVKGSGGEYHHARTTESDDDGEPLSRGAINGGLFRKGTDGIDSVFLEIEVGSIDRTVQKVLENGGSVVRPKKEMLDFGWFAVVKDPDGNFLGLMEYRQ